MQAVILAAGKGTRLGSLTASRSKAMMPIAGRPVAARVMDQIAAGGVDDFIVVAAPDDRELAAFISGGAGFKRVRMVVQPQALGMAHALGCAAPWIVGDFLLSACDNLTSEASVAAQLAAFRRPPQAAAVLALLEMPPERLSRSAVVALDGERVTRIVEKPAPGRVPSKVASLPLYVFSPAILDRLDAVERSARGEYELQDAIQALIEAGLPVRGVHLPGRMTLTRPEDLLALNRAYLEREAPPLEAQPHATGARLVPPVLVEPGVEVGPGCVLGPYVYAEAGCRVGSGARVREAVLLRGAVVRDGEQVRGEVRG